MPDGLPPIDNDDVTQDIPMLCTSFATHGAAFFRDLLARLDDGIRPPVSCLIPDGVMSFTLQVAEEMGISALVFWTTSVCGIMGYINVPLKGSTI